MNPLERLPVSDGAEALSSSSASSLARSAAAAFLIPLLAITSFSAPHSFIGMDFDQLMKIRVSSVQMRESTIAQTPAAVYVISSDDIRRSGATNIPDLLRTVPGLSVARVNGNNWAISARGGQDTLANKLLVMIDGRSVYTPLFAGVFWDVQDIPLESIDRIEVIRGPGGSVWGANAVNGVINIIRKAPKDVQGTMVSVGGGSEERFNGNVQTGWKMGERTQASAYGRYREFDALRRGTDGSAGDPGQQGGGGFRVDGQAGDAAHWMVSADGYSGQFHENRTIPVLAPVAANVPINEETNVSGENVMARFSQSFGAAGTTSVQTYYDRTTRRIPLVFSEVRDTVDAVAQHQITLARINLLTAGAGYRLTADRVGNSLGVIFDPDRATLHIANLFAQDEIRIRPVWSVTLGTKFEHNDYTSWETQPSARTSWEFLPDEVLWAAVSRAVRTPTRLDSDVKLRSVLASAPPTLLSGEGSDDFVSEKLVAYEAGYRGRPLSFLYLGVSGFYNVYHDLRGASFGTPFAESDPAPAHVIVPLIIDNDLRGETFGGEVTERAQIAPWWQVRAWYSYLHQRLHVTNDIPDVVAGPAEVADPVHQAYLRSSWNVGRRVELDAGVRWVGTAQGGAVDDYATADARAAWTARPNLVLEVDGQDLLERSHAEWTGGEQVQRSVFGKATWRFR